MGLSIVPMFSVMCKYIVNAWRMTSERVRLCFLASLSMSWVNLSGKRTFMISILGHRNTILVRLK